MADHTNLEALISDTLVEMRRLGYILHHRYHAAFLSLLSIAVMTHILALSMTE